ncbi:MAG: 2-octaprenyl-3-methyl-6-methoxy-1,4-benzoquinol hydroxylase [Congregibacter sp.]
MNSRQPRKCDIAIVGGGIAGLSCALALSGSGASIILLDANPLPDLPAEIPGEAPGDYDLRVSALTPRSIRLLERLGAWPFVTAARHAPYGHMTVWDAEGTAQIEFDASEVSADSLGSIVENRLIAAALAACVESKPDVSVLAPARLAGLQQAGDLQTLKLEDGSELRTTLLVAADGALSPTRELLGFKTREWDYGHRAIVTTAAFERSHEDTAWQRFLQTGPLALLPLPDAQKRFCSIVWSIEEAEADPLLALDEPAFCAALSEASEQRLGAVTACAVRRAFPLRQRHAVDYVMPAVALVGDAAHTIHPLAGQGINLGLADVEVLADEVSAALRRGLSPGRLDVLKRYQRRRKGDNLAMMAAMDGLKRLFGQDDPAVRWLRNTGMRGVGALPAVKRKIIQHAMGVA